MAKSLLSTRRRLRLNPPCGAIFFIFFLVSSYFVWLSLFILVDFFVREYGVLYDLVVFEYFTEISTLILVFAFAHIFLFFIFLGFMISELQALANILMLNSLNSPVDLLPSFAGAASSPNDTLDWKCGCFYKNRAWMEFHNKSGTKFGGGTLHI
jgi:hypothetical protein